MPTYRTAVVDAIHNNEELRLNLDLLEERRKCATIHEAKAKLKITKYYNARVRGITFRPGDFVYHSNEASHAMDGGKLGPNWEGPHEVTEALGDGAYRLRSMDGTVFPRTWNIANLKKCTLVYVAASANKIASPRGIVDADTGISSDLACRNSILQQYVFFGGLRIFRIAYIGVYGDL
ncbi:hypothetical protein Tco_1121678 [Tanacetum coccineum]|uniref:Reverse transcriptase domain-containing protein n=1 Tax=Tanacetum coccineum TaxID=301880 RepID=A0ABQ5J115_9ASTR